MQNSNSSSRHRVVIVGGGFAGLHTARTLRKAPADVTLIDRRNFHLFQPLLYQVATGGLSPANIAAPLRHILQHQKNCRVLLGEVRTIDPQQSTVQTEHGSIPFDTLVIAAGARHSYFGHDEWEPFAPGLKTIEDATEIRARILTAFESAELERDPERRRQWLTFVIVGGGPTGVELAGALAEISRISLRHDFRSIDPSEALIVLVEADSRVLSPFPADLSEKAARSLKRLGVTIRSDVYVTNVTADYVVMKPKNGDEEILPTRTVLWAAGVKASSLGMKLANATGVEVDRAERVKVEKDFSISGHPNIFVIGDLANYSHGQKAPLPGVAPVAIQEGKFVGRLIRARLAGQTPPEFHYHDKGSLATIGKSAAVAQIGWLKISGFVAWLLWLVVHLLNIVSFRNRLLVLTQWGWSYLTNDRAARLITNTERTSEDERQGLDSGSVKPRTEAETSHAK